MSNTPKPNQLAPSLSLPLVSGEQFNLDSDEATNFTLVTFYRGYHCPICRGYLAQLDRAIDDLSALGVKVVAVSGDSEERAKNTVEEWKLEKVRVAYGQSVESMRDWGLFVSKGIKDPEPELFGEPGIFLVRPDNTIYMVAINSMPAGRPRIEDIVGSIKYFVENDYPARGES